jgi:hypothetical protein
MSKELTAGREIQQLQASANSVMKRNQILVKFATDASWDIRY